MEKLMSFIKRKVSQIALHSSANIIFLIGLLVFLTNCEKQEKSVYGCTIPCATNYNPQATSGAESCRGCKNMYADNYCSGANTSDGSCKCSGDGFIILKTPGVGVKVYINGGYYGEVSWYPIEGQKVRVPVGNYHVEFKGEDYNCSFNTTYISECTAMLFECK